MKILYAIQGTGNGHLSRARDIIPILQKKGEVDILISGIQSDVDLPYPLHGGSRRPYLQRPSQADGSIPRRTLRNEEHHPGDQAARRRPDDQAP